MPLEESCLIDEGEDSLGDAGCRVLEELDEGQQRVLFDKAWLQLSVTLE